MIKTVKLIIFASIFSNVNASSLFLPDSDTAALVMLISNTASTVSNTLKILEVAKEASEQMDKYNMMAMRRFFIARRIEQHVRDIAEAVKMNPKDLRDINRMLLRLKLNLKALKSNIESLGISIVAADDFTTRHREKLATSIMDEKEMQQQEIVSATEGTTGKHVQNTAINTALSGSILSKIRRDSLDYQNVDIELKKSHAIESLRREGFYREWIGLREDR